MTKSACLALCTLLGMAGPCLGDDDAFVEADPTTVLGKGETSVQQWFGWTHGHCDESFNGLQAVSEFDYGVTDRLQLTLSVEYNWERARTPLLPAASSDSAGVSAEAIYVLIPAKEGRFGLSLAVSPWVSRDEHGFEARALMQRNVFGFENVLNIGFSNLWERQAGSWLQSSWIAFKYGIAFPLDKHWTVSLEANNERGFDGLFPSASVHESSDTYFTGPTVQYDCDLAVFSMGAQAQLPLKGVGSDKKDGFTPDAERFRVVARIAKAI